MENRYKEENKRETAKNVRKEKGRKQEQSLRKESM